MALDNRVAGLESFLKAANDEIIVLKRQIVDLESTTRAITDENEQVNHMAPFYMYPISFELHLMCLKTHAFP